MSTENTNAKAISDRLREPFPESVIEHKQGKSYIGHEHIRERVIDATDNAFDWHVASIDYRIDGAIRARSSGDVPPVMIVTGTLTIHGLGSRTGMGVQVIEAGAGEDTYKAAESDAFKRAAMAFGCGLQLYMNTPPAPRSSTRQHAPNPPAITPESTTAVDRETFEKDCAAAFISKDGPTLRQLVQRAGDDSNLWALMVKSAQTTAQIDWVADQMDKRGVGLTDAYTEAASARRKELE